MMNASALLQGEDTAPALVQRSKGKAMRSGKPGSIAERSRDSRQFWILYALTFPGFLVAALVMRVMQLSQPSASQPRGLFSAAHELASASIPYAFMG